MTLEQLLEGARSVPASVPAGAAAATISALAYDSRNKVVIASIRAIDKTDGKEITQGHYETWAYDAGKNEWRALSPEAALLSTTRKAHRPHRGLDGFAKEGLECGKFGSLHHHVAERGGNKPSALRVRRGTTTAHREEANGTLACE